MPKDDLPTTGKAMWYFAPILPVRTMKPPAMAYPIHTQSHDCHQARPGSMMLADEIIHVLMLKESAIQNATYLLLALSTGASIGISSREKVVEVTYCMTVSMISGM